MNIFKFFKRFTNNIESNLVKEFNKNPQVYIEPMISYFNICDKFDGSGRDYRSPFGNIHVCMDIYGPEVKIKGYNELLDICPSAYGLTHDQGHRLYTAILSCVPGTVSFKERVDKQISQSN